MLGIFLEREFEERSSRSPRAIAWSSTPTASARAGTPRERSSGTSASSPRLKDGGWAGAEETQHRVLDALDQFARGDYRDDVTTVVLAVKPNGSQ